MARKDYYQVLGVSQSASPDQIKAAFRKLAHQYHPDKGGDEKKFKEINEAYQVLSDPDKRRKYDQFGAADGTDFPGFNDFGQGFGGFQASGFQDIGDIFGSFFGGRSRVSRGSDIEVKVHLAFKEAIFGVTKDFSLYRSSSCSRCGGSGAEPGTKLKNCGTCDGHGVVTRVQRTLLGAMQVRVSCETCQGRGEIPEQACSTCRGSGVVRGTGTVTVKIPAGVEDGTRIRLRGEGENPGAGGEVGDLYILVHVSPDPLFVRQGNTLYSTKKIGFTQAVLGDTVTVQTVDGPVSMKVPPGTQSGEDLRLRGKGVPTGRGRGDQIVRIQVVVPAKIDRKTRQIIEDLQLRED